MISLSREIFCEWVNGDAYPLAKISVNFSSPLSKGTCASVHSLNRLTNSFAIGQPLLVWNKAGNSRIASINSSCLLASLIIAWVGGNCCHNQSCSVLMFGSNKLCDFFAWAAASSFNCKVWMAARDSHQIVMSLRSVVEWALIMSLLSASNRLSACRTL